MVVVVIAVWFHHWCCSMWWGAYLILLLFFCELSCLAVSSERYLCRVILFLLLLYPKHFLLSVTYTHTSIQTREHKLLDAYTYRKKREWCMCVSICNSIINNTMSRQCSISVSFSLARYNFLCHFNQKSVANI